MAQFIYVHPSRGRIALNVDHIICFEKAESSKNADFNTVIETLEESLNVTETFDEVQALCSRL